MKKMSKLGKSILLSTLAALAFGGVAMGTTYALFTSTTEATINATAGKVEIQTGITAQIYSPKAINLDGTIADDENVASSTESIKPGKFATFKNGGKVTVTNDGVNIENMTPGDKVTLTVTPENLSTVKTKYMQKLTFTDGVDVEKLLDVVKISETSEKGFDTGIWNDLTPGDEMKPFDVVIEMPATATEGFDEFGIKLQFEAVQANANVSSDIFKNNVLNLDNRYISIHSSSETISVTSGTKSIQGDGYVIAGKSAPSTTGESNARAVNVDKGATAVINGGNFRQDFAATEDEQWDLIYCNEGTIEINGGTFKSATPKWTLSCYDDNYKNGTAKIVVKGGRFYQYDPSNSLTEPNGTTANFVADGYKVIQDGDWYEVVKVVNDDMSANQENVTLDLTQDVMVNLNGHEKMFGGEQTKTITINGNGHSIYFNCQNTDCNDIKGKDALEKLTINDAYVTALGRSEKTTTWNSRGLVFTSNVELNNVTSYRLLAFASGKKAVLNNVTVNETDGNGDTYAMWLTKGAEVEANGLTINAVNKNTAYHNRAIKISTQYSPVEGFDTKLTIKNAKITSQKKAAIAMDFDDTTTINLENVDISGVVDDKQNAVWASAGFTKVTVNGGKAVQK